MGRFILFSSCAIALLGTGLLSAASISLDTVGADPNLTSPNFTFMTDQVGDYSATYVNVSNPSFDFITLELNAPFSSAFYFGTTGPKVLGVQCNPGRAFTNCDFTLNDNTTTVIFRFFGLDATHLGIPYLRTVGLSATLFEPNQTIGAVAATAPATTPESGAFRLAGIGLALCGLVMGGKKLLKSRVRA